MCYFSVPNTLSPFFRNRVLARQTDLGSPRHANNELRFTDEKIETRWQIEMVLEILAKGTPARFLEDFFEFSESLLRAYAFAQRYECQLVLQILTIWLGEAFRTNLIHPVEVFIIAAKWDQHELAAAVIRRHHGEVFARKDAGIDDPSWGQLERPYKLTLRSLSAEMWEQIPKLYLRALHKAEKAGSGDAAGEAFLKLVIS